MWTYMDQSQEFGKGLSDLIWKIGSSYHGLSPNDALVRLYVWDKPSLTLTKKDATKIIETENKAWIYFWQVESDNSVRRHVSHGRIDECKLDELIQKGLIEDPEILNYKSAGSFEAFKEEQIEREKKKEANG